jgi:hypothetical protein
MQTNLTPDQLVDNMLATLEVLVTQAFQEAKYERSVGDNNKARTIAAKADQIQTGLYYLKHERKTLVSWAESLKYPPQLSAAGAKQVERKQRAAGE